MAASPVGCSPASEAKRMALPKRAISLRLRRRSRALSGKPTHATRGHSFPACGGLSDTRTRPLGLNVDQGPAPRPGSVAG